jgi:hydroxymethylbilane synthase
VAQGALGIEARAEDQDICGLLSGLDHAETRRALEAERALLDAVQGGCQLPLGAWARMDGGKLLLDAAIFSADGLRFVRRNASAEPAEAEILGRVLAHELLAAGGGELLKLAGRVTHG